VEADTHSTQVAAHVWLAASGHFEFELHPASDEKPESNLVGPMQVVRVGTSGSVPGLPVAVPQVAP
jgi:hypothetical protein